MNGTWVSSVPAGRVRLTRLVFLACVVSGLTQKPLLKFAWDVQSLQTQLKRVHECMRIRCGGAALLGGTAILLRQIFATKGQEKVGDVAVSLAVAGKMWDKQAITRLHSELRKMDPRDTMKRKGFMTLWSGPKWVSGLAKAKNMKTFLQASQLVGDFLSSKVLEPSSFHELCVALNSPHAKLHNVATYSIPHMVRACCVARAYIHGDGAEKPPQLDATAWEKHLRDMHDRATLKDVRFARRRKSPRRSDPPEHIGGDGAAYLELQRCLQLRFDVDCGSAMPGVRVQRRPWRREKHPRWWRCAGHELVVVACARRPW